MSTYPTAYVRRRTLEQRLRNRMKPYEYEYKPLYDVLVKTDKVRLIKIWNGYELGIYTGSLPIYRVTLDKDSNIVQIHVSGLNYEAVQKVHEHLPQLQIIYKLLTPQNDVFTLPLWFVYSKEE